MKEENPKLESTYLSLVDLTRKSGDKDKYFSAGRVFWHGYGDSLEEGIWKNKSKEIIPINKAQTYLYLEVLREKGLAKRVFVDLGGNKANSEVYRAIIEEF